MAYILDLPQNSMKKIFCKIFKVNIILFVMLQFRTFISEIISLVYMKK